MKKYIFFAILALSIASLVSCKDKTEESPSIDPTVYDMPVTWVDHYINEFNTLGDWTVKTDTAYTTAISGGLYTITILSETTGMFLSTSAKGIPAATENYDIEISCEIGYDSLNSGVGLFWSLNPDQQPYEYYFYFLTVGNGVSGYIFGESDTPWITNWATGGNATGYNKMTVRKYGNKYYIFLNETLVHTQNYTRDFGDFFGFLLGPNSQLLVDWIHIKKVGSGSSKNGTLTEPSINNNGIVFKAKQRT